jgi:germination protein M
MRQRATYRLLASAVLIALTVASCDREGAGETTTSLQTTSTTSPETTTTAAPSTTTSGAEPAAMAVYFMLDQLVENPPGPFLVPVYREISAGDDPEMRVMEALLAGPSFDEAEGTPSMKSAIPEGSTVLGVEIEAGLATVDLSTEFDDGAGSFGMFVSLAQVVYTLTRLPGIDEVAFEIEGEPVTVFSSEGIELDGPQQRDDYYDLLPPIFVDQPAWGEPVTSPIQVRGLSNVFEAVSQVMLSDGDGEPIFEDTVMATCGTGCWGEWSVEIPYEVDREQLGTLMVWEFSAEDGSRIHVREYPVRLR